MKFISLIIGITIFQGILDAINLYPWIIVPVTLIILLIMLFWITREKKPKKTDFGSGLGRIKA